MEEEERDALAILTMLVGVSTVDGKIDDRELNMISRMAKKMNLSDRVRDQVVSGKIYVEIEPPAGEWERIPFFQMCVMTSGVNGDFDEQEMLFCKRLGMKLGLQDEVLDNVIALFKQYFPDRVPIEELRKAYQLGHN